MEELIRIAVIEAYAKEKYREANCLYDGRDYFDSHISDVMTVVKDNGQIFLYHKDYLDTLGAGATHDLIEDAKQTFNDIKKVCGEEVAKITLAVTDVHAENRLMRHLLTMHKTVSDHRAIILKMADMLANARYSKLSGSGMHDKYIKEYAYRKAIFTMALPWYNEKLNMYEVNKFWFELDDIHRKK